MQEEKHRSGDRDLAVTQYISNKALKLFEKYFWKYLGNYWIEMLKLKKKTKFFRGKTTFVGSASIIFFNLIIFIYFIHSIN